MVQLMGSLHSENFEDFCEEEYRSLPKRTRFEASSSQQQLGSANHAQPSRYNPLDEPSPLGLRLNKSLSLLDLIQMTLSQSSSAFIRGNPTEITGQASNKDMGRSAASTSSDKHKASNFPASLLRIGSWEYISKHEGDLVAKCYFAKHKLVWEVLDGGLKNKIEIQWSDITALKADLPDDGPGTLTLVLARKPAFFRETNPQPRKHTLWQATTDFTDGQASMNTQHILQCPPGMLNKHYEKLIQCDMRLAILSQQPEIVLDSPYFKSQALVNSEEFSGGEGNLQPHDAKGSPISAFQEVASLDGPQLHASESKKNRLAQRVSKEEASPSSVMDTHAIEGNNMKHDSGGLRPSMSMTDLMNEIGNRISEEMSCGRFPSSRASEMVEDISQVWLGETECWGLDETSLMKKVNSLCNLLLDSDSEAAKNDHLDSSSDMKHPPALPRKDSFSDLLLHLPPIASLPRFSNLLNEIAENDEY